MIRLRPHSSLFEAFHNQRLAPCLIRAYSTREPDSKSVNYPLLNRLYQEYTSYSNDPNPQVFKLKALKTAMGAINGLPYKVQRVEDVDKVKGIGKGIKRRIEEFLLSEDGQSDIQQSSQDVRNRKELLQATDLFQTVSGIGPQTARMLAEKGFRSLQDVINDTETFNKLPQSVRTALRYSSKIVEKIQRQDIDRIRSLIEKTLKDDFEVYITGSYRRGAQSSSDIDVLLFHKDYKSMQSQMSRVTSKKAAEKAKNQSPLHKFAIPRLLEAGLLSEALTAGPTKWQGLASLMRADDLYCRIDLNLMPTECRGAALVGLTGDMEFNRYLRSKAVKSQMRLNDFGLWKRPPEWKPSGITNTKHDEEWALVPTMTEEAIFEELKEQWVEPTMRDFNNLSSRRKRNP